MRKFIQSLVHDERGVSALEYAILAGMIVIAVGAAMGIFSGVLSDAFTLLGTKVTAAIGGTTP
jgi:pilus assembly protein Flp/PilA